MNERNSDRPTTGLGSDKSRALLKALAPVVMAFLAKRMFDQRQGGADAGRPGEMLGGRR